MSNTVSYVCNAKHTALFEERDFKPGVLFELRLVVCTTSRHCISNKVEKHVQFENLQNSKQMTSYNFELCCLECNTLDTTTFAFHRVTQLLLPRYMYNRDREQAVYMLLRCWVIQSVSWCTGCRAVCISIVVSKSRTILKKVPKLFCLSNVKKAPNVEVFFVCLFGVFFLEGGFFFPFGWASMNSSSLNLELLIWTKWWVMRQKLAQKQKWPFCVQAGGAWIPTCCASPPDGAWSWDYCASPPGETVEEAYNEDPRENSPFVKTQCLVTGEGNLGERSQDSGLWCEWKSPAAEEEAWLYLIIFCELAERFREAAVGGGSLSGAGKKANTIPFPFSSISTTSNMFWK